MRVAVYPGSFDPVTNGHMDIIERAAGLFDKVVVAVSHNPQKKPLFTVDERVDMIHKLVVKYPNVDVDYFTGLTVQYARQKGAQAIIRGLRAISDFENEFMMALTNKKLVSRVETIFLMTRAEYSFISSSGVKEVAFYGGCVKGLVPSGVEEMLHAKFSAKN